MPAGLENPRCLSSEDDTYTLNSGETLLIPAALNTITLKADQATILEVYL